MSRDSRDAALKENPFEYIGPVLDPARAIPRMDSLQAVRWYLERGDFISVLAPRQTGKTTFLSQLRQFMPDAIYIDMESASYAGLGNLLEDLVRRIGLKDTDVPGASEQRMLEVLGSPRNDKDVLFLIDELGTSDQAAAQFLQKIRARWQEAVMDGRLPGNRFVIAGSMDLARLTLDENPNISPFNIARTIYLDDFDEQRVREFILRLGGESWSDAAAKAVFEYTRGHPFLVQFVCHSLQTLPSSEKEARLESLAGFIDWSGVQETVNVQSMVHHLWRMQDRRDDYLGMLRLIVGGEDVRFARSHPILRRLYLQGCIKDKAGYCAIRNPIYRHVLEKQFEIAEVVRRGSGVMRPAGAVEADLEKRVTASVTRRIEELVLGPVLLNYTGHVHAEFLRREGTPILVCQAGGRGALRIGFAPEAPESGFCGEIRITEGVEAVEIDFTVTLDSEVIRFSSRRQTIAVKPGASSRSLTFDFVAPDDPGDYAVYVQVFQGTRLVQVVRAVLSVQRGEGRNGDPENAGGAALD